MDVSGIMRSVAMPHVGGERMNECPYCSSELKGIGGVSRTREGSSNDGAAPGGKNTGAELVSCPDCGEVIDGYTPH